MEHPIPRREARHRQERRAHLNQLSDRLLENSTPVPVTGCWLWLMHVNRDGYGTLTVARQTKQAHRVSYEALRGPVPSGLRLDHLCRVRSCINPDHLEPVPHRTNVLRGISPAAVFAARATCPKGHRFSTRADRGRRCTTCKATYDAARYAKRKEPIAIERGDRASG
jgi:hypothetical protein